MGRKNVRKQVMRMRAVAMLLVLALLAGCAGPSRAESPGLREAADGAGFRLGAAVDADLLVEEPYRELLAANVNLVTPENEMKWERVHPEQDRYDFSEADRVVRFAEANDMGVRGHALVWHRQLPGWLTEGTWTREELIGVLREHIFAVVGHYRDQYPGRVVEWDVVNEAFLPDGTRRPSIWQETIGDDYIELAFRFAREADPDAALYYNDFYDDIMLLSESSQSGKPVAPGASADNSTCDGVPRCRAVRDLVRDMESRGVPIDGVGFQRHLLSSEPSDAAGLTGWVADTGLVWSVTELDVPLISAEPEAAGYERQARIYDAEIGTCAADDACEGVVMWGITDRDSWLPGVSIGVFGRALPFDEEYRAKPAVDAIESRLNTYRPQNERGSRRSHSEALASTTGDEPSSVPAVVVRNIMLATVARESFAKEFRRYVSQSTLAVC